MMNEPPAETTLHPALGPCYDLGRAVGTFDPRSNKIFGSVMSNLYRAPALAPNILRHVWPEMVSHPVAGPVLASIDWENMPRVAPNLEQARFWLGFWHAKA